MSINHGAGAGGVGSATELGPTVNVGDADSGLYADNNLALQAHFDDDARVLRARGHRGSRGNRTAHKASSRLWRSRRAARTSHGRCARACLKLMRRG
jgi:hypothetical protein